MAAVGEALSIPSPCLDGPGTPESVWRACRELRHLRAWTPLPPRSARVVVVAPHPDDEVLGAGGTAALLFGLGCRIEVVAVTDGERSHPGQAARLRQTRPRESARAVARLGIVPARVHRLGQRDGHADETALADDLTTLLTPGDLVLSPWCEDGHPDHDSTGRAARSAAARVGATRLSYLVWAWHWASPETGIPWPKAGRVDLGERVTAAKRDAVRCFETQISGPDPVLPPHVLCRLTRSFEVLLWP